MFSDLFLLVEKEWVDMNGVGIAAFQLLRMSDGPSGVDHRNFEVDSIKPRRREYWSPSLS